MILLFAAAFLLGETAVWITPFVVRGLHDQVDAEDEAHHRRHGGVVHGERALQRVELGLGVIAADQVVDNRGRDRRVTDED